MKVQLEVKKIILGWYLKNKNEIGQFIRDMPEGTDKEKS